MGDQDVRYAHTRRYDLIVATPLVVYFGFVVAGLTLNLREKWPAAVTTQQQLEFANLLATLVFFGLQILLLLIRALPIAKTAGPWPRATAILGANFNLALLLVPRAELGSVCLAISLGLTLTGVMGAIVVLAWLGRGFSIFPEARRFVTTGPYRFVRHPLYLTEIVATFGIALGYRQPWALAIATVTLLLQLRRMTFEERVLSRAYPEYDEYRCRTAKLIPGLY